MFVVSSVKRPKERHKKIFWIHVRRCDEDGEKLTVLTTSVSSTRRSAWRSTAPVASSALFGGGVLHVFEQCGDGVSTALRREGIASWTFADEPGLLYAVDGAAMLRVWTLPRADEPRTVPLGLTPSMLLPGEHPDGLVAVAGHAVHVIDGASGARIWTQLRQRGLAGGRPCRHSTRRRAGDRIRLPG